MLNSIRLTSLQMRALHKPDHQTVEYTNDMKGKIWDLGNFLQQLI